MRLITEEGIHIDCVLVLDDGNCIGFDRGGKNAVDDGPIVGY